MLLPIPMDCGDFTANAARPMVAAQAKTDTPLCPIWMSDRLGEGCQVFSDAGLTPSAPCATWPRRSGAG